MILFLLYKRQFNWFIKEFEMSTEKVPERAEQFSSVVWNNVI